MHASVTAPSKVQTELEQLPRQELIALAKQEGFDRPANASNAALIEYLLERTPADGKTPPALKNLSPETIMLREQYNEAKARVKAAIVANQEARRQHNEHGTEETKLAYETTKNNHKAAITHIKVVRPKYQQSRERDLAKADES